ncbi:Receptor-like protein kinase HSL1 [Sesbania bispinosa]|nr:Receptor-like protein kinase HSL1 [Sesbania bispinosa]
MLAGYRKRAGAKKPHAEYPADFFPVFRIKSGINHLILSFLIQCGGNSFYQIFFSILWIKWRRVLLEVSGEAIIGDHSQNIDPKSRSCTRDLGVNILRVISYNCFSADFKQNPSPFGPEYGEKDLVKWVTSTLDEEGENQVIDPTLDSKCREEISKVLSVGFLCTSSLPITCPSMLRMVKLLRGVTTIPKSRSGKFFPYYQEMTSDNENQGSIVFELGA